MLAIFFSSRGNNNSFSLGQVKYNLYQDTVRWESWGLKYIIYWIINDMCQAVLPKPIFMWNFNKNPIKTRSEPSICDISLAIAYYWIMNHKNLFSIYSKFGLFQFIPVEVEWFRNLSLY